MVAAARWGEPGVSSRPSPPLRLKFGSKSHFVELLSLPGGCDLSWRRLGEPVSAVLSGQLPGRKRTKTASPGSFGRGYCVSVVLASLLLGQYLDV